VIFVALAALGAAGAAGFYAWEEKQAGERAAAELAQARSQLSAAAGEARAAREQADAARKEFDVQKLQLDQLAAERDSTRAFLEAEKAHTERLRGELKLAQDQLAFLRARGSALASPGVRPTVVQPHPLEIRAAPSSGSRQAVHASPAPAPSQ
jgi:hypothetical protein